MFRKIFHFGSKKANKLASRAKEFFPIADSNEQEENKPLTWNEIERSEQRDTKQGYNRVFKSSKPITIPHVSKDYHGYWAKKEAKVPPDQRSYLNEAKRGIKIIKEVHPDIAVGLYEEGNNLAWVMQYIEGQEPNDKEIRAGLLDIYIKSNRLVLDGCGKGNLIKTDEAIYLVDVDVALSRSSPTSRAFYNQYVPSLFLKSRKEGELAYWQKQKENFPRSISLLETIYYLEQKYYTELEQAYRNKGKDPQYPPIPKKYVSEPMLTILSAMREEEELGNTSFVIDIPLLQRLYDYQENNGIPSIENIKNIVSDPNFIEIKTNESADKEPIIEQDSLNSMKEISILMIEFIANKKLSNNPLLTANSKDKKQQALLDLIPFFTKANDLKTLNHAFAMLVDNAKSCRNQLSCINSLFFNDAKSSIQTHSCQALIKLLSSDTDTHNEFTDFVAEKGQLERLNFYDMNAFCRDLFQQKKQPSPTQIRNIFKQIEQPTRFAYSEMSAF